MFVKEFEGIVVGKYTDRELPTLAVKEADGTLHKVAKFTSEEDAEMFCKAMEEKRG